MNINEAVQILENIRFILFRDDSFTRGQPPISVTGHQCILSYVCTYVIVHVQSVLKPDRWSPVLIGQPSMDFGTHCIFKNYFNSKATMHNTKAVYRSTYVILQ